MSYVRNKEVMIALGHNDANHVAMPPALPGKVPERIQRKISAIAACDIARLESSHPSFHSYAKTITARATEGRPPGADTPTEDLRQIRLLCRMENARTPGLNLQYLSIADNVSDDDLTFCGIKNVADRYPPGRHRFILQAEPFFRHHIMADVLVSSEDRKLSAIFFDSITSCDYPRRAMETLEQRYGASVLAIYTGAQKSMTDCVMFALSHALKARDSHFVTTLHEQISGNPKHNIYISQEMIPAAFLKHAQSSSAIQVQSIELDQSFASQRNKRVVNSIRHAQPESLQQRILAHHSEYNIGRLRQTFGASIQGFRLQEILRTLEYLQRMLN